MIFFFKIALGKVWHFDQFLSMNLFLDTEEYFQKSPRIRNILSNSLKVSHLDCGSSILTNTSSNLPLLLQLFSLGHSFLQFFSLWMWQHFWWKFRMPRSGYMEHSALLATVCLWKVAKKQQQINKGRKILINERKSPLNLFYWYFTWKKGPLSKLPNIERCFQNFQHKCQNYISCTISL